MELCWSALKPWIANSVEIESATPYSVFEEVELAVGCPKEKDYYSASFPGIDHLVQPITDGELKIFAYFHNEGNEKLPTFSRHMIEIYKYRVKVLDAEMDSNTRAGTSSDEDWSMPTTHRLVIMVEQFKVHNRLDDIFNSAWFITVEQCRWDMDRIIANTIRKRNLKSARLTDSNPTLSEETRIDLMIQAQATLSVSEPCNSETNVEIDEENIELDVLGSPVGNSFHLLLSSDTDDDDCPTNKERNELVNDNQTKNLSSLKIVEEDRMEVDERNDAEQEINELLTINVNSEENISSKTSESTCLESVESVEKTSDLEPEESVEKTSSLEPEENVEKPSSLEPEENVEKTSGLEPEESVDKRSNLEHEDNVEKRFGLKLEESAEKTSGLEPEEKSSGVELEISAEETPGLGITFNPVNVNSVPVEIDNFESEKQGQCLEETGNKTLCSRNSNDEICSGKTVVSTEFEMEPQILVELDENNEIKKQEIPNSSLLFNIEMNSQTNLLGIASLVEMLNQTQSQISLENADQSILHSQNLNGEIQNLTYSQVQITDKEFVLEVSNHSEMLGSSSGVVLENNDSLIHVPVTVNSLITPESDNKLPDEQLDFRNCNFNGNQSGKSVNEVFESMFLPESIDIRDVQMCSSQSQPSSTFSPVFQSGLQVPIIIEETPFLPSIAEVMNTFSENTGRSYDVNRTECDDGVTAENDCSLDDALCSQVPNNLNFNGKFRMLRKRQRQPSPSRSETDARPALHCFECSKKSKGEETVTEKVSALQRVPRGSLPENDLKFLLESWKYVFSLTKSPGSTELNDTGDVNNS